MRAFLVALVLLLMPAAAHAAVRISFYSWEGGEKFPHAFLVMDGTLDATGEAVNESHGFTAYTIAPLVLIKSVHGVVTPIDPKDIDHSILHFSLTLTDAQYQAVKASIDEWNAARQPSYNLNRRNCINFVSHVMTSLGLDARPIKGLEKRPNAYMAQTKARNEAMIVAWNRPAEPVTVQASIAPAQPAAATAPAPAMAAAPATASLDTTIIPTN